MCHCHFPACHTFLCSPVASWKWFRDWAQNLRHKVMTRAINNSSKLHLIPARSMIRRLGLKTAANSIHCVTNALNFSRQKYELNSFFQQYLPSKILELSTHFRKRLSDCLFVLVKSLACFAEAVLNLFEIYATCSHMILKITKGLHVCRLSHCGLQRSLHAQHEFPAWNDPLNRGCMLEDMRFLYGLFQHLCKNWS